MTLLIEDRCSWPYFASTSDVRLEIYYIVDWSRPIKKDRLTSPGAVDSCSCTLRYALYGFQVPLAATLVNYPILSIRDTSRVVSRFH